MIDSLSSDRLLNLETNVFFCSILIAARRIPLLSRQDGPLRWSIEMELDMVQRCSASFARRPQIVHLSALNQAVLTCSTD